MPGRQHGLRLLRWQHTRQQHTQQCHGTAMPAQTRLSCCCCRCCCDAVAARQPHCAARTRLMCDSALLNSPVSSSHAAAGMPNAEEGCQEDGVSLSPCSFPWFTRQGLGCSSLMQRAAPWRRHTNRGWRHSARSTTERHWAPRRSCSCTGTPLVTQQARQRCEAARCRAGNALSRLALLLLLTWRCLPADAALAATLSCLFTLKTPKTNRSPCTHLRQTRALSPRVQATQFLAS
jgi:hypothetical protein